MRRARSGDVSPLHDNEYDQRDLGLFGPRNDGNSMTADIQIPETFAEASELLTARPVGLVPFQIKGQQLALQGAESGIDAAVPAVGDCYIGAILDLPTADVPVTGSMLDSWGVEMSAVVAAAARNRSDVEASVDAFEEALVISGVPFAAAALRDPAAVGGFRPDATPVILVPDPGVVVLGFVEQPESLVSLARAGELALANATRTVSATPLVRSGDSWAPFDWPEAARAEADRLRKRWDSVQYGAARDVVQATYAAAGSDVFVAELALATDASGEYVTYATVVEGVASVVPRAQFLVLTAEDGRSAHVPFDAVADAGVLVPAAGTVPEYFSVERFPAELI